MIYNVLLSRGVSTVFVDVVGTEGTTTAGVAAFGGDAFAISWASV